MDGRGSQPPDVCPAASPRAYSRVVPRDPSMHLLTGLAGGTTLNVTGDPAAGIVVAPGEEHTTVLPGGPGASSAPTT